jgi:hypothetical protein
MVDLQQLPLEGIFGSNLRSLTPCDPPSVIVNSKRIPVTPLTSLGSHDVSYLNPGLIVSGD